MPRRARRYCLNEASRQNRLSLTLSLFFDFRLNDSCVMGRFGCMLFLCFSCKFFDEFAVFQLLRKLSASHSFVNAEVQVYRYKNIAENLFVHLIARRSYNM